MRRVGLPADGVNAALVLRHGAFDVVHVHEPGLPVAPLAAARGRPRALVATFHAAPAAALRRAAATRFGFADALVAGSSRAVRPRPRRATAAAAGS